MPSPTPPKPDVGSILSRVESIVGSTPVHDVHTHLYDPSFGSLLLTGIDELLTYHYLVSESFRQFDSSIGFDRFWAASKTEQADWIWKTLFFDHAPVSEACRGVITTLQALGLEPRQDNLGSIRSWFAAQKAETHVNRVLELARVSTVHMTNSPFDDEERRYWDLAGPRDPRFVAALRIDPLLLSWDQALPRLQSWGYRATADLNASTASEVRRFLADWTRRFGSTYCMVSLPPSFAYPTPTETNWLIENAVLPHCRDHGQPFALMMGVRRAVNPQLRMAGDGMGRSDMAALQNLCEAHPSNRFLTTCLSRENQHDLVVLARKFRNLHPFGCWWFTNTPQLVAEITSMRLELLGTSFTPQHSDARVLDQLIYKWRHSRQIIASCLASRYEALAISGWTVTDAEMQRDARELLGGGFNRFLKG